MAEAQYLSPPAVEAKHRGLLTVAVMAAMIMVILDMTIANVALPHMQASLGAAQDTITWVLTSYIVAQAIMTPITGWLADNIGRKNLFMICVAGFVGASALCGTALGLDEMVLFRILQGAFGAALAPLSQSVIIDINPRERQGQAMAAVGRRHHDRADHRADHRRLPHRQLQLALGVLHQRSGRRAGARRHLLLHAGNRRNASAASISSASRCSRSPSVRCSSCSTAAPTAAGSNWARS